MKIKNHLKLIGIVLLFSHCNKNAEVNTDNNILSPKEIQHIENKQKFEETKVATTFFVRRFIEEKEADRRYFLGETELFSSQLIAEHYQKNNFSTSWIPEYDSTFYVSQMLSYIQGLSDHGFNSEDYHLAVFQHFTDSLEVNPNKIFDAAFVSQMDIMLTDVYFMIAAHLYHGKVDQEAVKDQWGIQRNKNELPFLEILVNGIQNRSSIEAIFEGYYPKKFGYEILLNEVRKIKTIVLEDQEKIQFEPKTTRLKLGDSSNTVVAIKKTLNQLAYLNHKDSVYLNDATYDSILFLAVKNFQKNYGYIQNGGVNQRTLNFLNLSIEEKLNKLYVNMERMRWMPEKIEKRYVLANIADNTLYMMNGEDTAIKMKMIVGREFRETPIFYAQMKYLVFSPMWTVPQGILRKDVLPSVRRNPNYLSRKNMYVTDLNGNVLNPANVNWNNTGSYRIRQRPGKNNALGLVKFMFPNKHNVYLHDTPDKELFERETHTFSSGCIRLEKPADLAYELLKNRGGWTREKIDENMNRGRETMVFLEEEVGVYIFYLTAFGNGEVYYRQDIYNLDNAVLKALKKRKYHKEEKSS